MNRYQVLEVFIEHNDVKMQALNNHRSLLGIFWYYPVDTQDRLRVIDCHLNIVHNWQSVEKHMACEALKRIQSHRILDFRVMQYLYTMQYIDANNEVCQKGLELINEIERPTTFLMLSHIKSSSKLLMK
jgi:hypothetical protein